MGDSKCCGIKLGGDSLMSNNIQHHGVLGMHWGRHKQKSTPFPPNKKKTVEEKAPPKRTVKEMTDAELQEKVNRMGLERRYKDAMAADARDQVSKGKKFISGVLEQSGKQVATQIATYAMGNAVNKMMKAQVVNVKSAEKK